ncbi:MAG TPA: hypothetical protein VEY91_06940 [Candidatus Limnocylindria bacterium]|nr:hypothetical protein [Candidatus Limnocylindria bacterium]
MTFKPPISTRHALALAFDLAVRRDLLHSIVVPLLLRAPWVLTLTLAAPQSEASMTPRTVLIGSVGLIGDFVTLLVVGAMLRIRARSVFNTDSRVHPAPALECYARGLRRIPWLLVTEVVRNFALAAATSFSILPAVFVRLSSTSLVADLPRNLLLIGIAVFLALPALFIGFRLAVATEAVVLDDHDLAGAFQHSFKIMRDRFERWLELIVASATLVLGVILVVAMLMYVVPALSGTAGTAVSWLLVMAVTPIIQYAWTFFYLRLVEIESPLAPLAGALDTMNTGPSGGGRLAQGAPAHPVFPADPPLRPD